MRGNMRIGVPVAAEFGAATPVIGLCGREDARIEGRAHDLKFADEDSRVLFVAASGQALQAGRFGADQHVKEHLGGIFAGGLPDCLPVGGGLVGGVGLVFAPLFAAGLEIAQGFILGVQVQNGDDVQINVESYWGSAGLAPLIIGNSVLHCQRSGSHVRDLHYSWEKDGYAGNDLSLLAPQLVETHKIRQWAFQQSPGSTVWAVRDDGILLGLTYMQEQNVFAWSRHVTDGKVLSVVVLSGDEEDAVLMVVEREIAGVRKYFLERLARRFRSDDRIEEAFFVDCGITATHAEAVEEIAGLDHLEGAEVAALADGSPEEGHVVKDGKIRLRYPARVAHVGLNFRSVLAPLPVETDTQSGSTLGKRRAYGKCVLRLHRSVGGKYAASYVGDLFDVSAWGDRHFYDLPFVPVRFGEAVRPFSGDLEISLPSGQDNDTMIWIIQDRPMPFRLVAIAADVDFGEV